MVNRISFIPGGIISIILMICISDNVNAQPKKGKVVPEFSLADSSGNMRKLSDLRGKVVLIEFWASWCGPCRRSNPALRLIYSRYQSKGFEIYGISIDQSSLAWKNAIITDQTPWTQVIDNYNRNASLATGWKIDFIPASFLVSSEGKLVSVNPSHRQVQVYLKRHLKESVKHN